MIRVRSQWLSFGAVVCFSLAITGFGGSGPDAGDSGGQIIRTDANMVLVPVTVTDRHGRPVPDLDVSDFVLQEERTVQPIISLSRESAPISLGVVFDLSGSMTPNMVVARAAVREFLNNLEPGDETFLVTFADRPELRVGLTTDASFIEDALRGAKPLGSTSLYDAVGRSMDVLRKARHRRKILFLVSDGGDNHSRLTLREIRNRANEEDVQVYAIGIRDLSDRVEALRGSAVLDELAGMTGGQNYLVTNLGELPGLAAKMSLALHECYVIGYRPTATPLSGAFRRIKVEVVRGATPVPVWVYARRGYRMP
jgi:Ca-activated chloride channel family protein